jgi:hypothetical protein
LEYPLVIWPSKSDRSTVGRTLLSLDRVDEPIHTESEKSRSHIKARYNTEQKPRGTFFSFNYPRASNAANFALSVAVNRAKEQIPAKIVALALPQTEPAPY